MREKHDFQSRLAWILLLWSAACAPLAVAQQSSPGIDALILKNGRSEISLSGKSTSYYILHRSEDLQGFAPIGGILGADATLVLLDESLLPGKAFYRVQAVPMDTPLDTDEDGIDDVYELMHPAILDPLDLADADRDPDNDGLSNLEEYEAGSDPESGAGGRVTTFTSSPGNGADDVAVTRETILRFSRPLKVPPRPFNIRAETLGQHLSIRLHTSPDLQTVTLFYADVLPSSSTVRVTINPGEMFDADGIEVDLDGDGKPGGFGVVEFQTLTLTELPGTAVVGRVFASELGDEGVNQPLSGVVITVDGRGNDLRAVTDALGDFRLAPAPAGRFFVHIDGRAARGGLADGAYYPFVGKAWQARAGEENNIGEVYLPLVRKGTLQQVSATDVTEITFADSVLVDHPELEGVKLEVPPDSLYSDDGTRGGMVGIAPVDPARLPGKLPEDLGFPLVITVQTDGPTNFDQAVPACFPNLPNPRTGQALPTGSKSALWSFNHDTGRFEIVGPMTVSANGRFVCTDPGVGIRAPGWHGTDPGSEGDNDPDAPMPPNSEPPVAGDEDEGGEIEEEGQEDGDAEQDDEICTLRDIEIAFRSEGFFIFRAPTPGFTGTIAWQAPGGAPSVEIGNIMRTQFCQPGDHTVTVTITKRGDSEPCDTKSITVSVAENDVIPRIGAIGDASSALGFNDGVNFSISPNIPGDVEWSIEPGEHVVFVERDTRADRAVIPELGINGIFSGMDIRFCEGGNYTVSARYTPDHCGGEPLTVSKTIVVPGSVGPELGTIDDSSTLGFGDGVFFSIAPTFPERLSGASNPPKMSSCSIKTRGPNVTSSPN